MQRAVQSDNGADDLSLLEIHQGQTAYLGQLDGEAWAVCDCFILMECHFQMTLQFDQSKSLTIVHLKAREVSRHVPACLAMGRDEHGVNDIPFASRGNRFGRKALVEQGLC